MVRVGADREGGTPVPIPNTEVKSFIADDTAGVTLWESRTAPTLSLLLKLLPDMLPDHDL